MFSRTIICTVLGTVVAAMLLSPAASAGVDPTGDRHVGLDPAIVTALHNRAEMNAERMWLDPAIAAAIRDRSDATSQPLPLEPAIRAAILEHQALLARPDDRAGARGVGSLPQPNVAVASGGFDWSSLGLGAGAALAALLLALGSAIRMRQARTRVTNA